MIDKKINIILGLILGLLYYRFYEYEIYHCTILTSVTGLIYGLFLLWYVEDPWVVFFMSIFMSWHTFHLYKVLNTADLHKVNPN